MDNVWEEDSEILLKAPYKFKAKSVLQEWCQSKGFDLPVYKIIEVSKKNGDPKRFSCDIFIKGSKESSAFGKSHKQAEKNAAKILIEKFITKGIIWLYIISKLINLKVMSLSQLPPSKRTAALFFVTLCTKPLYPLYIDSVSFTTTKEPGSIGLVDNSIKKSIYYNIW